MKYAKIENDKLVYAPNILNIDGKTIINPKDEHYRKMGYKPIEELDYTPPKIEEYKPTYEELVSQFIREKYSQDEVEAIINNYLSNAEKYKAEFDELQAYRLECKARAKNIKGISWQKAQNRI